MENNIGTQIRKSLIREGLLWLSLPSFIILMSLMLISDDKQIIKMVLYVALAIIVVGANIRIILKAQKLVSEFNKENENNNEQKGENQKK